MFHDFDEVLLALHEGLVETQTQIRVRYSGPLHQPRDAVPRPGPAARRPRAARQPAHRHHRRPGDLQRASCPTEMPSTSTACSRSAACRSWSATATCSTATTLTVEMLDDIKDVGFEYATQAGLSFGIDDMLIPAGKEPDCSTSAKTRSSRSRSSAPAGVITDGERYNKIIDIWTGSPSSVAEEMFREMGELEEDERRVQPDLHDGRLGRAWLERADPPARRHARPDGQAVGRDHRDARSTRTSARACTVLEYFISTHGARKGLADTALKTADSGYLTRRLVDVAQDVDHHRATTAARSTASRSSAIVRGRRDRRAAARPHRRPRRRGRRSSTRSPARCWSANGELDHRGDRQRASRPPGYRAGARSARC